MNTPKLTIPDLKTTHSITLPEDYQKRGKRVDAEFSQPVDRFDFRKNYAKSHRDSFAKIILNCLIRSTQIHKDL